LNSTLPTASGAKETFRQDVALIHIFAKDMNLVPRKIMCSLICQVQEQEGEGHRFKISVDEILRQIGYTSRDLRYFHDALRYLMSSRIEWNIFDVKGKSLVGASTFLASYQIVDGKILEFSFSDHLLERVKNPQIFATPDMQYIRPLSRVGGIALYQTCKRYINLGETPWHSVEMWRKQLDAMSPNYDDTRRFMEKVIRPAQEEISQVTDLDVSIDVKRENRRISLIRFLISPKAQQLLQIDATSDQVQSELFEILVNDFGISEDHARRFVVNYPEAYVRENIAVVHAAVQKGKVKNVSSFLFSALEKDYRKKETFVDRTRREEEARKAEIAVRSAAAQAVAKKEREVLENRIWAHVSECDEAMREDLFRRFVEANSIMFKFSERHRDGFVLEGKIENSPMVRAAITEFLVKDPVFCSGNGV